MIFQKQVIFMFTAVFCLLAQINAQKMNFFVKNLFNKREHIRLKLRIYSHLLNKSLTENFIFCVLQVFNTWRRLVSSLLF